MATTLVFINPDGTIKFQLSATSGNPSLGELIEPHKEHVLNRVWDEIQKRAAQPGDFVNVRVW